MGGEFARASFGASHTGTIMETAQRDSGIPAVASVPCGAHFCQFCRDEADLAETLIPFFKTGLQSKEACLWITSASFDARRAVEMLREAVLARPMSSTPDVLFALDAKPVQ
jgi:hypothetical protein